MDDNVHGAVALEDGEGNELIFYIEDVVPYRGKEYAVLLPDDAQGESVEFTVLELVNKDGEDEFLKGIDDEETLEAVFKEFLKRQEM